ncbi:hypothetical protein CURTO8I2_60164 [Curtobacterium sp. 8I-2]|nr:hypothetical protein CURTO8I2_60164 [Curtobacterium sp. 8I-2]
MCGMGSRPARTPVVERPSPTSEQRMHAAESLWSWGIPHSNAGCGRFR